MKGNDFYAFKQLKQRYLNVRLLSITDRQNDFVDDPQFAQTSLI